LPFETGFLVKRPTDIPFADINSIVFKQMARQVIPVFQCPSEPAAPTEGRDINGLTGRAISSYCGNVGSLSVGDNTTGDSLAQMKDRDGILMADSSVRLRDITDGTTSTIMTGEVRYSVSSSVCSVCDHFYLYIMNIDSGQGFDYSEVMCTTNIRPGIWNERAFGSHHVGGLHVSLCDGSSRFVGENISLAIWRALGSRAGSEVIGEF
jgi:hypothetical protein